MRVGRLLLKNRMTVCGGGLLSVFLVVAFLSAFWTPHDPRAVNLEARNTPPNRVYLLGTDSVGRDILSRTMAGARVSLRVGVIVVGIAIGVGAYIGVVAGYYGGNLDAVLMRVVDVMLALPGILLAMGIVSVLGPSLQNAMMAVAVVSIPQFARVMRAEVLRVKALDFVTATRALGATDGYILWKTILPNCLAPLIVQGTLGMGTAILETAALSYLGLGDDPSTPEWGRMLADQFRYIRQAWWTVVPPLVAISLVVLGFNLLGDGLREGLDPRLKTKR